MSQTNESSEMVPVKSEPKDFMKVYIKEEVDSDTEVKEESEEVGGFDWKYSCLETEIKEENSPHQLKSTVKSPTQEMMQHVKEEDEEHTEEKSENFDDLNIMDEDVKPFSPQDTVIKDENQMDNDWTEEDMRKAITAFRQGRSMRHAAELFGVPRSCLHRRLQSGSDVPLKKKGGQTTFTSQQEEQLVQRILRLSACGCGLNSDDVRKAAFSFAEKNGIKHKFSNKTQTAGMDWLIAFRKRHPEITLRKAEALSLNRCKGLNRHDVQQYFDLLGDSLENLHLLDKPHLIYNCDESGFQLNNKPCKKLLAKKGCRSVYSQTCVERGETVTILACTNAVGNFIPPMGIFKGKKFRDEFADGFPNGSLVIMTDSGWINEDGFLRWLNHFQAHRVPGTCLLLLDGHISHKSLDALQYCEDNNIHMICLPSHTTHRLQPLDRSFFKPLKDYYDDECNTFLRNPRPSNNEGERKITKLTFGGIFKKSWMKAATPAIAESGFRSTGVYPFDANILPDYDFLPSQQFTIENTAEEVVATSNSSTPMLENETQAPTSSITFGELLPSPVKQVPKQSKRKQQATLLASPKNISLVKKKKKKEEQKQKLQKKTRTLFPVLPLDSDAESEEDPCGVEKEGKDEKCAFCLVRFEDPKSSKLGDCIQCQGAGKEWYNTTCVGAEKKKNVYMWQVS